MNIVNTIIDSLDASDNVLDPWKSTIIASNVVWDEKVFVELESRYRSELIRITRVFKFKLRFVIDHKGDVHFKKTIIRNSQIGHQQGRFNLMDKIEEDLGLSRKIDNLITTKEAAELVGISTSTYGTYAKKGILPKPTSYVGKREGKGAHSVRYSKKDVIEAIPDYKAYKEKMRLKKVSNATNKNRKDADERVCKAPDNFKLAWGAFNGAMQNNQH